jgi:integrase
VQRQARAQTSAIVPQELARVQNHMTAMLPQAGSACRKQMTLTPTPCGSLAAPLLSCMFAESMKPADRDRIVWDSDLKGFGLRVKPSGTRSFIVQYRAGKGRKWSTKRVTIGQFGTLTVQQARKAARETLAAVVLGADPRAERDAAARALTVAELCDEYLCAAEAGSLVTRRGKPKASSTLEIDRGRIARHIKPLIGKRKVKDLTPTDVRRMFEQISAGETALDEATGVKRGRAIVTGGTGTAKMSVKLLRAVLTFGVRERHVAENVAAHLPLPADGRRSVEAPEQLLQDIGAALEAAKQRAETWQAVEIIRLMALTGMRREEAVTLEWEEIDFERCALRLSESKTGYSVRPLGGPAFEVLFSPQPLERCASPAQRLRVSGPAPSRRRLRRPAAGMAPDHDALRPGG